MTDRERDKLWRAMCKAASWRHAITREHYVGSEERLPDIDAQMFVAKLLYAIRCEWRAEKREMGL